MILYSIPLLALVVLLSVYYVATVSPQAQVDFKVPIAIQIVQLFDNTPHISTVLLKNVGVRGGVWASHQYDGDGLDGHYPLFGEAPPNGNNTYQLIHVRSRVVRTYTLLDFFNVWGEPLGPTNTLGYPVPPPSNDPKYTYAWYWDMCVQGVAGGPVLRGAWGNETLIPGKLIVLRYSDDGCGAGAANS